MRFHGRLGWETNSKYRLMQKPLTPTPKSLLVGQFCFLGSFCCLISLTCLQCFKASRLFLWSMVVSHLIAYRYNISPSMALPSERLTTWLIDNIAHSLNFIQSRTGPDPYNSTSSHLCQNKSASSIYSWLQTLPETSTFQIISLIPIHLREVFLLLSSLFDTAFPFKESGGRWAVK